MDSAKTRAELTEKLLGIKRAQGWSWKHICGEIGGMSPMLIVGAVLGQMKLKAAGRQGRKSPSRRGAPHSRLRAHAVALAIQMRSN